MSVLYISTNWTHGSKIKTILVAGLILFASSRLRHSSKKMSTFLNVKCSKGHFGSAATWSPEKINAKFWTVSTIIKNRRTFRFSTMML